MVSKVVITPFAWVQATPLARRLATRVTPGGLAALAGFIVAAVLAWVVGIAVQPHSQVDDMASARQPSDGLVDPLQHTSGFYPPEVAADGTTFRWTGANASLTFPYAGNLGRHARVLIRATSGRPPGEPPAQVTVRLNGREVERLPVMAGWQTYSAEIDTEANPNPFLEASHVQVDLESSTFTSDLDKRTLGVQVDRIELVPEVSRLQIAETSVLWALMAGTICWLAFARLNSLWRLAFPAGAVFTLVVLYVTYLPRAISPMVEGALAGLAWLIGTALAHRRRPVLGLLLALCGVWLVVAGRLLGDWQMDDAYISYRYAWNFLHGSGLVYNPGEIVEGYTNFSWTLISAAGLMMGLLPAALSLALNIGLGIGLVGLAYALGVHLWGGSSAWPLLAAVLTATDGAVLTYGARGSGMEAIFFALLTLLAAFLLWALPGRGVSPRAAAGLVLAVAALTRPEGFLVAAVFIFVLLWAARRGPRTDWAAIAAVSLPFLAVVVPYEIWRISFYGYLFPNTFYAKTGATLALVQRGLEYTGTFLGERWLLTALAMAAVITGFRKLKGVEIGLTLLSAVYLLYIVWAGGDHFPGWRFLVPLVAPLSLLAVSTARRVSGRFSPDGARPGAALLMGLALGLHCVSAVWLVEPQSVNAELTRLHTSYVNRWGSAGLWLRENTPPGTWTAAKGAGAIAYYSRRPVIDVYGLNDLHIGHLDITDMGEHNPGHDKQDPANVLARKPDYILDEWLNYFQTVKGQLKQQYSYLVARTPTGPELAWWQKKQSP
ncbi:MAG TPA: hypothetical protein VM409_04055 [Chloroflexia bacterium]|nr:hypothetical protein [Chloroflexia bacterium]